MSPDSICRDALVPERPTGWEKVFVVTVLLYSTGALFPFLQGDRDPGAGVAMGTTLTNVIWALIYIISFRLLVRNYKTPFQEVRRNWLLIGLVSLPCISVLWSVTPALTLLHIVALCGTALVSVYLARRFNVYESMRLCLWTLGIAGVCSAFLAIFLPRYGIGTDEFAGIWLGVYGHKNSFGAAMAMGFLVALLLLRFARPVRFLYLLIAGFMFLLVYLSNSTTSLVICLLLPLILWGTQLAAVPSSHLFWRRAGVLALTGALLITISLNFEEVADAVGRDDTFTGRTAIWALVTGAILDRPVLGYGYEAFWRAYEGQSGELWERFGQPFSNAHNGLLEIWLGMGVLGVLVVGAALVFMAAATFRRMRRSFCLETVWPWMFICYLFISNLTEATFLHGNILPTILFLMILQQIDLRSNPALEVENAIG